MTVGRNSEAYCAVARAFRRNAANAALAPYVLGSAA